MKNANQFEARASRSRSKHEGESSAVLCDRPSRTRDSSQRQLPTDHDHAVPTREYQTDQSSPILLRLWLALALKRQKPPTPVHVLTGSLHIRTVAKARADRLWRQGDLCSQSQTGAIHADSSPCGHLIPADVGTENALMWAAITPRCGQDFEFHRNRCPHGVNRAHMKWNGCPLILST